MKSFGQAYLQKLKFPADIMSSFGSINEFKGKEGLYMKQSPAILEKLLENAMIQSTESSNRLEGVTALHWKVRKIVKANAAPRNKSEQEIAGYRDVLNLIQQSYENIPVSENVILQFHSMLFRFTSIEAGFWRDSDLIIADIGTKGLIVRLKPASMKKIPSYMNRLFLLYNSHLKEETYDPLILIALFALDLYCIQPFNDGNGRIARLLTLMLLYKAGYCVGKYISLEKMMEESNKSYSDALEISSKGWYEGKHNVFPWIRYFYGILLAAYKEFESRIVIFSGKGSKTEQAKAAIERFVKPFSISDVEDACPNMSRELIRKVLRQLRDEGKIMHTSMGRGAKWIKKK